MTTKLGKIVADFQTQLATSIAIGGTTATIQSATDDDGVSLPSGNYYFTIDGDNTAKEHIFCALSGTSITSIQSVSRQGVLSSGTVRKHRIGATITITDFAHISKINDLLTGTTDLNGSTPLAYDAEPTFSYGNHELVTWDKAKDYADGLAIAGAPDSDDTTKGLLERATMAEIENGTSSGSTTAPLAVVSGRFGARLYTAYAADAGANDTYAITCNPAPTQYSTGMVITFKANTANTGACTVNVNSLGAKAIQKRVDSGLVDLNDGDIGAGAIITAIYNGTQFELQSRESKQKVSQSGAEIYAVDNSSSSTAYTLTLSPALIGYSDGMVVHAKIINANTTTTPTLSVNGLTARTIVKLGGTALAVGDITANSYHTFIYDLSNTRWVMQDQPAVLPGTYISSSAITCSSQFETSTTTSTTGTVAIPANATYAIISFIGKGTSNGGTTATLGYGGLRIDSHNTSFSCYASGDDSDTPELVANITWGGGNVTLVFVQNPGAAISGGPSGSGTVYFYT